MSGNSAFSLVEQTGWQAGLKNLLRAEFRRWWKTRTWWVQSLIWVSVVDLVLVMIISASKSTGEVAIPTSELIMLYGVFGGMFTAVGVVIVMQGAIVGEKNSGTAAWVLSKPISRAAFVLSKLIANSFSVAVTSVLIPGVAAYLIISLGTGTSLSPVRFLSGMAILFLFVLYFLALTLMLGAFFNQRGAVIGIPLALILGQQFILGLIMTFLPVLVNFLPFMIVMPPQEPGASSIVGQVISGTAPLNLMPVYSSIATIILFTIIAIWRFRKEEF